MVLVITTSRMTSTESSGRQGMNFAKSEKALAIDDRSVAY